jgi:hypothetical protein
MAETQMKRVEALKTRLRRNGVSIPPFKNGVGTHKQSSLFSTYRMNIIQKEGIE